MVGEGAATPRLVSLERARIADVVVSAIDMRPCRFRAAEGIAALSLEATQEFAPAPWWHSRRQALAEEHLWRSQRRFLGGAPTRALSGRRGWYPSAARGSRDDSREAPHPREIARVYRELRRGKEVAQDSPGADDLYYGEMEMRRHAARLESSRRRSDVRLYLERAILSAYKLIGGYGVRPLRPFVWFFLITGASTYLTQTQKWVLVRAGSALTPPTVQEAALFVVRSAVLLPTRPEIQLTDQANALQIALRILGPLLAGLAFFGVRARVRR
jgi:hypothetical protein